MAAPPKKRNRRPKYLIPDDEVRRLYVDERQTDAQIATRYGCGPLVIADRRKRLGIPTSKQQARAGRRLTRAVLEDLYVGQQMSQDAIARQLGIAEATVTTTLRRFGIGALTPADRRSGQSILADPVAAAFVLGCVFGDGHLASMRSGSVRLEMKHALDQRHWLQYKARRLRPYFDRVTVSTMRPTAPDGWTVQDQVRGITSVHEDLATMHPWTYGPTERRFTDEALDRMTPLTVAVWLLDDGTLSRRRIYTLYAMRYPRAEVERAAAVIAHVAGVDARVRHHRDGMHVIMFRAGDAPAISRLIRREVGVIPGMEHKLLPE